MPAGPRHTGQIASFAGAGFVSHEKRHATHHLAASDACLPHCGHAFIAGDATVRPGECMSDFVAAMAARSDAELLDVVNAPEGTWRDEALTAARAELTRRGVAIPSREVADKARAVEFEARAQLPLDARLIVGAIFTPMCFFPWLILASSLEKNGYLKKARTLRQISLGLLAGYLFLFALSVLARKLGL